MTPSADAYLLV